MIKVINPMTNGSLKSPVYAYVLIRFKNNKNKEFTYFEGIVNC